VPADDEQGSVTAFEKAGLAKFPAATHVIAPVTDLRTLFRSIVPALPGPIAHLAWCKSHRQPLQPEPIGAVIEVTVADQPGRVQYSTIMRRIR
jgi:hypothetical protein